MKYLFLPLMRLSEKSLRFQVLIVIAFLLVIPVVVLMQEIIFGTKSDEVILREREEKLRSLVETVLIPGITDTLKNSLHTTEFQYLSREEQVALLKKAFKENAALLVPSNPGIRFGLYFPGTNQIFTEGFLHQYRELSPEEQVKRERRILQEARSGLLAVSASGQPLAKLTTSLNDETFEYLAPLKIDGKLVAVVWADQRVHPVITQNRHFRTIIRYITLLGFFVGTAGALLIIHNLSSGVSKIKEGLAEMEKDIHHLLPELPGEVGQIARAVNKMAISLAEKEKLEEELHRSERLAALGRLVTGVAHELRNPIGIIKTTTQIMEGELGNSPEYSEHFRIIKEQIERQNRVIQELLDFGRPSKPVLESVCLNNLLEKVLTFTAPTLRQQKIDLHKSLQEDLPRVMADGEKIKQVFVNLILNAVQSMPSGGKLVIETAAESGWVAARFTDTGSGIPAEDLPKIFDPFYTTKKTGTGLGLSISHQIISMHRGTIEVSSTEGVGTAFTVKLPIACENGGGSKDDTQDFNRR